jgi:hypothetical protein
MDVLKTRLQVQGSSARYLQSIDHAVCIAGTLKKIISIVGFRF